MTEPWLGHRDWCALQWQQPCDCPNGAEYLAEAGLTNEPEESE